MTSQLQLILAPNAGPMTLDGTNTWIIGSGAPVVVDPGPLDEGHLAAVLDACGGRASLVVLTHRHHDHSDGAARFAELAGCPVRSADPKFQIGPNGLSDGDLLPVAGGVLTAWATPGHTSDSFSLLWKGNGEAARLLTGDMVLGRGTTVITHPDGDLGLYFDSIARLQDLVNEHQVAEILPGHGPVVSDPAGVLAYYQEHRRQRLAQVEAALAAGDRTAAEVVARVYAEVDLSLWPAAEQSVRAQLDYLARRSSWS